MNVITDLGHDAKKFFSILDKVGKDAEEGLLIASKYAIPAANLVGLFFPPAAAGATAAQVAINLIQNAVLEIKQKSALLPKGLTTEQMIAAELQLVEGPVLSLLAQEKIQVPNAQVQKIIQAIAAILDAQPAAA